MKNMILILTLAFVARDCLSCLYCVQVLAGADETWTKKERKGNRGPP